MEEDQSDSYVRQRGFNGYALAALGEAHDMMRHSNVLDAEAALDNTKLIAVQRGMRPLLAQRGRPDFVTPVLPAGRNRLHLLPARNSRDHPDTLAYTDPATKFSLRCR